MDIQALKEYTDKYRDPENRDEILGKLREKKTMKEVVELVKETYPEWIVTFMDRFSRDYAFLQHNWVTVCNKMGVRPTQIMIVEDVEQDDNHQVVRHFAECFTRSGFAVRRKMEFIPCENCGAALPSSMLYDFLKEKDNDVPDSWNKICRNC